MNREFNIKGVKFYLGNYTPRNNEFEKGLKYKLYVGNIPTSFTFSKLSEGKKFATENYWLWL